MATEAELRAVVSDDSKIDYDEYFDATDEDDYPYLFCVTCRTTFDATWGDFGDDEQLKPGSPWRLAAEHWLEAHGAAPSPDGPRFVDTATPVRFNRSGRSAPGHCPPRNGGPP